MKKSIVCIILLCTQISSSASEVQTILGTLANLKNKTENESQEPKTSFKSSIQQLIFSFLKEPVFPCAIAYNDTNGRENVLTCFDARVQRMPALLAQDIVVDCIYGYDYAMKPHLLAYYKRPEAYAAFTALLGSSEQPSHNNCIVDISNPTTEADLIAVQAWFTPSDAEQLLSAPCDDENFETVTQQTVDALKKSQTRKQLMTVNKRGNFARLAQWQNHETFLEPVPDTIEEMASATPAASFFPPNVMHTISSYLPRDTSATKTTIFFMTPIGLMRCPMARSRCTFAWEHVEGIVGTDTYGNEHALVREKSCFTLPRTVVSCDVASQEQLTTLAERDDAQFNVPDLQGIWLQNRKSTCNVQ